MALDSIVNRRELLATSGDPRREMAERSIRGAAKYSFGLRSGHGEISRRRFDQIGDVAQSQPGVIDVEIAGSAGIVMLFNLHQKKLTGIGEARHAGHEAQRASKGAGRLARPHELA